MNDLLVLVVSRTGPDQEIEDMAEVIRNKKLGKSYSNVDVAMVNGNQEDEIELPQLPLESYSKVVIAAHSRFYSQDDISKPARFLTNDNKENYNGDMRHLGFYPLEDIGKLLSKIMVINPSLRNFSFYSCESAISPDKNTLEIERPSDTDTVRLSLRIKEISSKVKENQKEFIELDAKSSLRKSKEAVLKKYSNIEVIAYEAFAEIRNKFKIASKSTKTKLIQQKKAIKNWMDLYGFFEPYSFKGLNGIGYMTETIKMQAFDSNLLGRIDDSDFYEKYVEARAVVPRIKFIVK